MSRGTLTGVVERPPRAGIYLERVNRNRDIVFQTDHGDSDYLLLRGLRHNIKDGVLKSKWGILFPQWLLVGAALFWAGIRHPNSVYVTFGNTGSSYFLMVLQWLFFLVRRPRPHVMFGCLWEGGSNPLRYLIIRLRAFLVNRVVSKCIVNGERDVEEFSEILGILKEKLVFLVYHHTLKDDDTKVSEGDYVFSGGTDCRDYAALMKVCDDLSIPLKIATRDQECIRKAERYPNCEVKATSPEEFLEWMAGSRVVVLPFGNQLLRTGGHQTMVNSFYMGKPLLVYHQDFARGYIEDDVTGSVVSYGDMTAFRKKLSELYNDREKRERFVRRAKIWAEKQGLSQEEWVYRVYNIAAEIAYGQRISSSDCPDIRMAHNE